MTRYKKRYLNVKEWLVRSGAFFTKKNYYLDYHIVALCDFGLEWLKLNSEKISYTLNLS